MSGCATTRKTSDIVLPPEPVREELQEVHSVKDMADMIDYYEYLVQEWEAWGESVKKIVQGN